MAYRHPVVGDVIEFRGKTARVLQLRPLGTLDAVVLDGSGDEFRFSGLRLVDDDGVRWRDHIAKRASHHPISF